MSATNSASMGRPILLILTGENCDKAIQAAFEYAKSTAKRLRILQILTSDLYHYGHHDLVASRHSKREFLLHIREEVLERGKAQALVLENKARAMSVSLEIETLESDDIFSASLVEAEKGFDFVFVPKQEKKLFPLFKPTLAAYLKKKIPGDIIAC
jgi:hypothetical protein